MADRFLADEFQNMVEILIIKRLNLEPLLTDEDMCDVLRVACEEILEGPAQKENFLRNLLFWGMVERLKDSHVKVSPQFQDLILACLIWGISSACARAPIKVRGISKRRRSVDMRWLETRKC
jgi:hypothetical protein